MRKYLNLLLIAFFVDVFTFDKDCKLVDHYVGRNVGINLSHGVVRLYDGKDAMDHKVGKKVTEIRIRYWNKETVTFQRHKKEFVPVSRGSCYNK